MPMEGLELAVAVVMLTVLASPPERLLRELAAVRERLLVD
jgi:hypothetical protein